jgi:hypothetical protein
MSMLEPSPPADSRRFSGVGLPEAVVVLVGHFERGLGG